MSDHNISSVQIFTRLVEERFQDFVNRMNELTQALGGDDKQEKITKAQAVSAVLRNLQQALASQDRPSWLLPLLMPLETFVNHQGSPAAGCELIRAIGNYHGRAVNHQWAFSFSDDKGFDFDGVFQRYESESKIPELFDKIAGILEEIIKCPNLDSRKIIHTLETIIATLKKNRNGSFFGVVGSWNFVGTYLKTLAWNTLAEIPGLNILANSLRDALDETNTEMGTVHDKMQADLQKQLSADFPVLQYHPLPIPERLAIADETVVDVESEPVKIN